MEITKPKTSIYERLAVFITAAVTFLMVTFFLPTTTEFFEFNKLALLTLGTTLLVTLLIVKMFAGEQVHFVKSHIDLSLALSVVAIVISTLFSIDKSSSIWGAQGRWFPSLFGFLLITLYYYVITPNFKSVANFKLVIASLVGAGTLSSIVALLSYFQVYLGQATYLRLSSFTLTGSTTTALLVATVGTVFAAYLAYKVQTVPVKFALLTAAVINFAYVAVLSQPMGWVMVALGLLLTVGTLGTQNILEDRVATMFLATAFIAITLLVAFPATRDFIRNTEIAGEIKLPIRESWVVAAASIQDYPLLATGPSTFHLNFSRYRPLSMNNGATWNIRFDKPYNELFNIVATTGIIGFAVFLFFAVKSVKMAVANLKSPTTSGTTKLLAIGVLMLVTAHLFTYATVLSTFLLFTLLALLSAAYVNLNKTNQDKELFTLSFTSLTAVTTTIGETSAIKREYANLVAFAPILLATLFGSYLFGRVYLGEVYMRQALVAATSNDAIKAYEYQGKAIAVNSKKDTYHTTYAQTNLAIANALAAKRDLTNQEKQTIQTLLAQSIRSSRIATEVLNPANVANWETRALVYRTLINVADNASEWSIGAYNTAINLEPTNPALRVDLGGIYFVNNDFLSAANLFRQAAALKNDYANAHFNFAQALINLKDIEGAKRELQTTQSLVSPGSEDFKLVQEQIAAIEKEQAAVAGAATDQKPTVEQISGQNQENATTQEPLSTPSAGENGQNLNPSVLPQNTAPSSNQ
jgi:Flp pilus assembly protein TadD